MALAPDVILATGNATVGPLHQATHTVPIVFMLGSLVRVRLHRRLNKIKCGSGFRRASEAGIVLALLQHQLKAPTQRDDKPVDMCCGGDRKAIVVVLTAGEPLGIKS
jgi:hypothetical protein